MHVISLEVEGFRNLGAQKILFDPELNILWGENAQGKTNALEAICLCALGKSPRTDRERELIARGEKNARVKVEFSSRFGSAVIDFAFLGGKRRIAVNSVPIMRTGDLMGYFNAVWFSPDELRLVREGPAERRRFMDIDVCQTDKSYLDTLTRFNKTLSQRNNLLRDGFSSPSVGDMLSVWDQVLAKEGAKLIRKRREFVSRLAPLAAEVHYGLSGSRESLSVRYVTGIEGETQSEIAENYAKALLSSREKDLSLRHTSVGAQRDDVRLSLGQESEENVDVRIYGSRGQQRTAALAMKIAETRVMREVTGDYPTLLLDDVLSELDEARQKRLLSLGGGVQIILTSANPVSQTDRGRIFRVESGRISPQQP